MTCYECYEAGRFSVPRRSYLFRLAPAGLNTPYTERLSCFATRLAGAHRVRVATLVTRELLPRLEKTYLLKGLPANFWKKNVPSINGTQAWAREWIELLETLTGQSELRFLSMITWAEVLPPRGLLRTSRAWCPLCHEEWRLAGAIVYEPLLWALRAVTVCPRHQWPLCYQCPHQDCRRDLPLMSVQARPGYCCYCGRWLGQNHKAVDGGKSELRAEILQREVWIADAIGSLIAAAPGLTTPPTRERIAKAMTGCIEYETQGNVKAWARKLGVPSSTVQNWQLGRQIPQLETLMHLCHRIGVAPLEFLTEHNFSIGSGRETERLPVSTNGPRRTPRRILDRDTIQQELEAVLGRNEYPPPSMREIARRLEHDHSYLLKLFPNQCHKISARFLAHLKTRRDERDQRMRYEIWEAVFTLHHQGVYPGAVRIRPLLSDPWYLLTPEGNTAWHEALQEIGLE